MLFIPPDIVHSESTSPATPFSERLPLITYDFRGNGNPIAGECRRLHAGNYLADALAVLFPRLRLAIWSGSLSRPARSFSLPIIRAAKQRFLPFGLDHGLRTTKGWPHRTFWPPRRHDGCDKFNRDYWLKTI